MKVYEVEVFQQRWEYWYDHYTDRCWHYRRIDAEGNQLGSSYTSHSKEYALIGIGIAACERD